MIPGEVLTADGDIELNAGAEAITLAVSNTGDRPVQVGSHYHFFETNPALQFDRAAARADDPGLRFAVVRTRRGGCVEGRARSGNLSVQCGIRAGT